ncbi:hypothetical protein Xcel_0615 [Xylanimonas cellulosilytica DSM 15894]|uniref:Carboxypeptidase regulatory-like domain-containing protein n=1 Tax=Xylanimonas cellulosilytica (strain DSM 15894 / JCM 12276 / CECT 5975 / KCTC 9989 / LMG 20990 / NBRC 107835 / XIL07) TaxID=446471 RepID=D1BWS2_XYLCX|nr:hypothetical protein [Xylanimonas cellulosilytica]ACZ29654.1 hypothetical protein Xcel_0615 [Xylanimonas cellulosilytica DSM 15894]
MDSLTFPPDVPIDDIDLAVLASLARAVAATDPVPDGLVERSRFAMSLAALEQEVAEVMSMASVETLAGAVRSASAPHEARTITFTHDSVTVMIALSPSDEGGVRVDGWLAPAAPLTVVLRQPGGEVSTAADDDGRFSFAAVDRGPASLLVRPDPDGTAVTTPVIEL